MLQGLEEIDCNESIWNCLTDLCTNNWNLENQVSFAWRALKKQKQKITADDIDTALWNKFPNADSIDVEEYSYSYVKGEMEEDELLDKKYKYFAAKVIIYVANI